MKKTGWALTIAAFLILALRLLAGEYAGPFWGVNQFRYLTPGMAGFTALSILVLLSPLIPAKTSMPGASARFLSAPLVGLIFLAVALVLPAVATPLLGDGIDRIEAMPAGLKALRGQPAPLDLVIHVLWYRAFLRLGPGAWDLSWVIWRLASYVAGAIGAACLYKLASLRAEDQAGRYLIFAGIFITGTSLFFFGYVEDYVLLAAGIYAFLLLIEMAGKGRAPVWVLFVALTVLVGLHLFMILLLPPLVFSLHRSGKFKLSKPWIIVLAVSMAAVGGLALLMVREHYRGLAIFVPPRALFSAYHLVGFMSQQILACPGLPLLLPLALWNRRSGPSDPLLSFLGWSCALLLPFFFILRPVIGEAADWDLFAIPSLFYAPWLVLSMQRGWSGRKDCKDAAASLIFVSALGVVPWLFLNMKESSSIARFQDLMEYEVGHNTWAASYGYYRLGKYEARSGRAEVRERAEQSLLRSVRINPDSATLRFQVASVFLRLGKTGQARDQMVEAHVNKALYYERIESYEEAALQYNKALELAPGSGKILEALARLYEGPLHDPDKAAEYRGQLKKKHDD
jgi:hypothetical protein